MSTLSRSLRRQSRQQDTFNAHDLDPCLQHNLTENSASNLSLFAEQDLQGHGDQFSGYLKDGYNMSTSEHSGNVPPPTLASSGYLNPEIQSGIDQILGSPYPGSLDRQQTELAGNFEPPGFFDQGLSQGPSDGNAATQDPWNHIDRRAMTEHQSLMPPPVVKRLRTDSGYSTITQQNLQQLPRQSAGSVASAPAAHYPDPLSTGAFSQSSLLPSPQTSNPYPGLGPGVHIAHSHDEMSITSHSDAGRGPSRTCCDTAFRNESSRKKHIAKHERRHRCKILNCKYSEAGFSTSNDLDRHRKTYHKIIYPTDRLWKCLVPGCSKNAKDWPRRDNFKAHLRRIHELPEKEAEEYMKKAEELWDTESKPDNDVIMTDEHAVVMQPNDIHKSFRRPFVEPSSSSLRVRTSTSSGEGIDRDVKTSRSPSVLVTPSTFHGLHFSEDQLPSMSGRYDGNGKRKSRGEELDSDTNAIFRRNSAKTASAFQPGISLPPAAFHDTSFSQLPFIGQLVSTGLNLPLPDKAFASRSVAAPGDFVERQRHLNIERKEDISIAKQYREGSSEADFAGVGDGIDPALTFLVNDEDITTVQQSEDISLEVERDSQTQDSSIANCTLGDILKLPPRDRVAYAKFLMGSNLSDDPTQPSSMQQLLGYEDADGSKIHRCRKDVKGEDGKIRLCGKRFDKASDLKKHVRRHDKRFACTFDCPNKRFGTKHEWRRHEQTQHEQHECWKCDHSDGHTSCDYLSYEKQDFKRHLAENHKLDDAMIHDKTLQCRIARRFQGQFWCGFCARIVPNDARMGTEKDKRRYDHITAHLDDGFNMNQWVSLANNGRRLTRSGTDGTTDESNLINNSAIEEEIEDEDVDEQEEDDDGSRFETAISPMDISQSKPTLTSHYSFSRQPYASQQDSVPSIVSTQKDMLSVSNSGPMHRPRAVSDSGQNRIPTFCEFICCNCGHGRQKLGQSRKCEICNHRLPCSSCDIFDNNGRRLHDNAQTNFSTFSGMDKTFKMRIDEDTCDDMMYD